MKANWATPFHMLPHVDAAQHLTHKRKLDAPVLLASGCSGVVGNGLGFAMTDRFDARAINSG